ncbi:MAG: NTP transferase domain-containing protein [Sphingobacteriales bacterium]|nr:NTP transferase domain-containing protein [Sphingobacteriales bacterium]
MNESVSVILLAAGNSARMNRPKPFLPFDEKENFVDKITGTYISAGIKDLILVVSPAIEDEIRQTMGKKYPGQPVEIVVNSFPERNRFYSLQLGLQKTSSSFCFIQNIDNPFVAEELLAEMIKLKRPGTYVVPVNNNQKGHPVLVSAEVMNHCRWLDGYDYNIREELMNFEEIKMDWPDEKILTNINTTELYQQYFQSCEVFMK